MLRNGENGLWTRGYECASKRAREACRASKISIYEDLDDYVQEFQEYSGSSDLVLANFGQIFLLFGLFAFCCFLIFGLHYLTKVAKKITRFAFK